MNALINVRLTPTLLKEATAVAKEDGFGNVQEVIRTALRTYLEEKQQMKRDIESINRLAGSQAHKPLIMSEKQARQEAFSEWLIENDYDPKEFFGKKKA
jgi:Arc/MetJ-type ribon-helix-helix transcriptional regulator